MSWLQLSFPATSEQVDSLSDVLWGLGAVSVTVRDAGDKPVLEPGPGETPIWDLSFIDGLFAADDISESDLESALATLADIPEYQISEVPDQDWERAWLADFKPMQFGSRLWIVPTAFAPVEGAVNIILDPGLAFGTGTHPTTDLCLQWLDASPPERMNVLDFGCGSGILAIAALKLGAKKLTAVDIDPQAITATISNAQINQVESGLISGLPDILQSEQFDLVLANILSGPLVELAPKLASHVKPGGQIVLSGILSEQADDVLNAYKDSFNMDPVQEKEGWVRLSGKRIAK